MRIDKFLWLARLARSRSAAQAMAAAGTIRLDGRRVERAHVPVRVGAILTLAVYGEVRVLRILSLPSRRGAPAEAALLIERLTPGRANSVDAAGDAA